MKNAPKPRLSRCLAGMADTCRLQGTLGEECESAKARECGELEAQGMGPGVRQAPPSPTLPRKLRGGGRTATAYGRADIPVADGQVPGTPYTAGPPSPRRRTSCLSSGEFIRSLGGLAPMPFGCDGAAVRAGGLRVFVAANSFALPGAAHIPPESHRHNPRPTTPQKNVSAEATHFRTHALTHSRTPAFTALPPGPRPGWSGCSPP
jgi:hypothetical protein